MRKLFYLETSTDRTLILYYNVIFFVHPKYITEKESETILKELLLIPFTRKSLFL